MSRSKGKQSRIWASQVVHIKNPPLTSPAQLVFLAKKYFPLDKTIYSEYRMHKIRKRWMKMQMKTPDEEGGLTCAICGRKGLQPWTNDINRRAELDHIVEICNNGSWNDPANFQVLCHQCNDQKNDILQKKNSVL